MSTLSTGPVGPGDAVDKINATLVMRSCNMDGLLLKPSKPAFAIDAQLWQVLYQLYNFNLKLNFKKKLFNEAETISLPVNLHGFAFFPKILRTSLNFRQFYAR